MEWCFCFTVDTLCSVSSKYEDILFRGSILVSKLLKQGCSSQTTFQKLYDSHTDLVHKFDISVSHMLILVSTYFG